MSQGGGGGSGSTNSTSTTTQSSAPWADQQKFLDDLFNQAQTAYNGTSKDPYTGSLYAGTTANQNAGWQATLAGLQQQYTAANAGMAGFNNSLNAGTSALTGIAGGGNAPTNINAQTIGANDINATTIGSNNVAGTNISALMNNTPGAVTAQQFDNWGVTAPTAAASTSGFTAGSGTDMAAYINALKGAAPTYDQTTSQATYQAALDPLTQQLMNKVLPAADSGAIAAGAYGSRAALNKQSVLDDYTRNATNALAGIQNQQQMQNQQLNAATFGNILQAGAGGYNTAQGLDQQTSLANTANEQQTALANAMMSLQGQTTNSNLYSDAQKSNQQAALQAAGINTNAQLATNQANQAAALAASQANQSNAMQAGLANQTASLTAAQANQNALLTAARDNQGANLTASQANQAAALTAAQANQNAGLASTDQQLKAGALISGLATTQLQGSLLPGQTAAAAGQAQLQYGNQQQQDLNAQLQALFQSWQLQQQAPWQGLSQYANAVGGNYGGTSTGTTTTTGNSGSTGSNVASGAIGGGLLGASFAPGGLAGLGAAGGFAAAAPWLLGGAAIGGLLGLW